MKKEQNPYILQCTPILAQPGFELRPLNLSAKNAKYYTTDCFVFYEVKYGDFKVP